MGVRLAIGLLLCLWSESAWGQTKSENPDKAPDGKFSWSGRIFVGNTLTRRKLVGEVFWRNQQEVESARFGLKYKHKSGVKAVIKVESSGSKLELRDGYVQLPLFEDARVVAGRHKRPMSGIALAGRWDLPTIERGLLTDLELPFVGGREQGLTVRAKLPLLAKPVLSLAIFQGDEDQLQFNPSETLDATENFTQDIFLRLSVEPVKSLVLATSFAWVGHLRDSRDRSTYRHGPMGSAELEYKNKRVRLWLEGFAGRNITPVLDDVTSGRFIAARGIVAPVFRTETPRRLIPYLGVSFYDPRIGESEDSNTEGQVGATLGFSKLWRLQFEFSHVFAEGSNASATEGTAFRVQLGAKFKE